MEVNDFSYIAVSNPQDCSMKYYTTKITVYDCLVHPFATPV